MRFKYKLKVIAKSPQPQGQVTERSFMTPKLSNNASLPVLRDPKTFPLSQPETYFLTRLVKHKMVLRL